MENLDFTIHTKEKASQKIFNHLTTFRKCAHLVITLLMGQARKGAKLSSAPKTARQAWHGQPHHIFSKAQPLSNFHHLSWRTFSHLVRCVNGTRTVTSNSGRREKRLMQATAATGLKKQPHAGKSRQAERSSSTSPASRDGGHDPLLLQVKCEGTDHLVSFRSVSAFAFVAAFVLVPRIRNLTLFSLCVRS